MDARDRERQLKAGSRVKKLKLIEESNPECLPDCVISARMITFGQAGGERLVRNIIGARGMRPLPPSTRGRGILHPIILRAELSLHQTTFLARLPDSVRPNIQEQSELNIAGRTNPESEAYREELATKGT
jgi:hypothetical protein